MKDLLAAAVLWAATFIVYTAGADHLGFYADDGNWLSSLPSASPAELWHSARNYMPGRNLHPLWHSLFYKLVGNPVARLQALHQVQSAVDGLLTALFFLLLRRTGISAAAAVSAAGLFAFWHTHGETHFWLESLPMNLVSTLLVVVFALTSLAGPRRWLWLLDAAAFLGALFTYDQTLLPLALIAAARVARRWSVPFAVAHIPFAAAAAFCVWMRLSRGGGPLPRAHANLAGTLLENIADTFSNTLGPGSLDLAWRLFGKVTPSDWRLALGAAAAVVGLAAWLAISSRPSSQSRPTAGLRPNSLTGPASPCSRCSPAPCSCSPAHPSSWPPLGRARLLLLAVLFYLAAYVPVWLWWPAPRHHLLPSVALFAAAAVALDWLRERMRARSTMAALLLLVGGATLLMAAASRGESRFWEHSFAARRILFTEIAPDLDDKDILVLEDFPHFFGPTWLISPQDPNFGPPLFFPGARRGHLTGVLSGVPAPGGIYLSTHPRDGEASFRYHPTDHYLVVRFTSLDHGRLRYRKNPAGPPYHVLESTAAPAPGRFAVHRFSARPDGGDLVVWLDVEAGLRPYSYLTAIFHYSHGTDFHRWARIDPDGAAILQPVLLSDPGPEPRAGPHRRSTTLRLHSFPPAPRIRVDLYAAGGHGHNLLLGSAEAPVGPAGSPADAIAHR